MGQFNTKFSRRKNCFVVVFNIWNAKNNKVQLNNNSPGISLWLHLGKKGHNQQKKTNVKSPLLYSLYLKKTLIRKVVENKSGYKKFRCSESILFSFLVKWLCLLEWHCQQEMLQALSL